MRGYWQPHLLGGSNARLAAYEAWHAVLGAMQVLHFGEGIWRPSYVFVLLVILLEEDRRRRTVRT